MKNIQRRTLVQEISNKLLSSKIKVSGWVSKIKKLGSITFFFLEDKTGLVQVFVSKDKQELIKKLKNNSVVSCYGTVFKKQNSANDFEIHLDSLTIYSTSTQLPISDNPDIISSEESRLKYRYLDLRRKDMQRTLKIRHDLILFIRNYLSSKNFIEVETPILAKSTPEGARDFVVPSRKHKNKFYSLSQSPQIYKQLLMVSKLEKYFQIARCFRDEDFRSDRQPEFTQLDIEMSFVTKEEIILFIEEMIKKLFKFFNIIIPKKPFKHISYEDAMLNYGSDAPDLRFELKLFDFSEQVINSNSEIIKSSFKKHKFARAFVIDKLFSKKDVNEFINITKKHSCKNLGYIILKNHELHGPAANLFNKEDILSTFKHNGIDREGTLLFIINEKNITLKSLGIIRKEAAKRAKLIKNDFYEFVWVIDWPLFERDNDTDNFSPSHHPFTSPTDEYKDNFDKLPNEAKSKAYDLVLNGYEIGGGSIRIINPSVQERMFKFLGISDFDIKNSFGTLIESFNYGVPPHGGIAFGIDRLVMIICNQESIKDVIAFPKNNSGIDVMINSPSNIIDMENKNYEK